MNINNHRYLLTIILISFLLLLDNYILDSQTTLINFGASWYYYDNLSEPNAQTDTLWHELEYDVSMWNSGNAELGYGDGDENTLLNDNTLTGYFRHIFAVVDTSIFDGLDVDLIYDDGAIVYLNGVELWRINMPAGAVSYGTFASSTSNDNDVASQIFSNSLVTGDNILAVEVHQRSGTSSDISFNFKLTGTTIGVPSITRGPYLQIAGPDIMTIRWRTSEATESIIDYGTALANLNQSKSDLTLKINHEIKLAGLSNDKKYYYQIRNSTDTLKQATADLFFHTIKPLGGQQDLTAWILGDCGTGNSNARAVRDAYINHMGSDRSDMVLFLGDNAYDDGTDDEYQFALFENMYEDILKNTVSYSCLGNHDGHSAVSSSQTGPYYDIFSLPSTGQLGGMASGTEAYYSFDFGKIHFIILDSYHTPRGIDDPMYAWCKSDIQDTQADWIIALWHHPPYTKGSHNSDTEGRLKDMRQNYLPMLDSNGVDLVLSGHSHSMERSFLLHGHYGLDNTFNANIHTVGMTGDGDGKIDGEGAYVKETTGSDAGKGAVYITTGSAGKTSSASLDHDAMYYAKSVLGSCVLEISGNQLHVKFIRSNEVIDDYFTITKNGLALPVELSQFEATLDDDHVNLTWTTASEIHNSHFDIEVSEEFNSWQIIGQIPGKGNSAEENTYHFIHENIYLEYPEGGLLYYRLRQVDYSGEVSYSVVRALNVDRYDAIVPIHVYPNPVSKSQLFHLQGIPSGQVQIMDIAGKMVYQKIVENNTLKDISIDISHISPGTYFLSSSGGRVQRFIITE